jgi:NAD(P)H-dependent FMN reductase
MKVLAISGSLQLRSSNSQLIREASARELMHVDVHPFTQLAELPHFNPDLDGDSPPGSVIALRTLAREADALLIASPEYAHEMPGSLKNALDWLVSSGELYGKPAALLCASPSSQRGTFAREALQRTLEAEGARVVLSTTVAMTRTPDGTSRVDPAAARVVEQALQALRQAFEE